jgi:hypothetical protein
MAECMLTVSSQFDFPFGCSLPSVAFVNGGCQVCNMRSRYTNDQPRKAG